MYAMGRPFSGPDSPYDDALVGAFSAEPQVDRSKYLKEYIIARDHAATPQPTPRALGSSAIPPKSPRLVSVRPSGGLALGSKAPRPPPADPAHGVGAAGTAAAREDGGFHGLAEYRLAAQPGGSPGGGGPRRAAWGDSPLHLDSFNEPKEDDAILAKLELGGNVEGWEEDGDDAILGWWARHNAEEAARQQQLRDRPATAAAGSTWGRESRGLSSGAGQAPGKAAAGGSSGAPRVPRVASAGPARRRLRSARERTRVKGQVYRGMLGPYMGGDVEDDEGRDARETELSGEAGGWMPLQTAVPAPAQMPLAPPRQWTAHLVAPNFQGSVLRTAGQTAPPPPAAPKRAPATPRLGSATARGGSAKHPPVLSPGGARGDFVRGEVLKTAFSLGIRQFPPI